jgi:hypothetical protein
MANDSGPQIDMSRIPVAGVGGLGLVAMACVVAYRLPEIRAFSVFTFIGGVALAVALIAYRRWVKPDPPHGPTLMVATDASMEPAPSRASLNNKEIELTLVV